PSSGSTSATVCTGFVPAPIRILSGTGERNDGNRLGATCETNSSQTHTIPSMVVHLAAVYRRISGHLKIAQRVSRRTQEAVRPRVIAQSRPDRALAYPSPLFQKHAQLHKCPC